MISDVAMPLVTVIIAVRNGEQYLNDAITSVLKQSYRNIELLLIDGGSTDGTLEMSEARRRH